MESGRAVDGLEQGGDIDRLGQVVVDACRMTPLAVTFHGICGDRDHRQMTAGARLTFAQGSGCREAIDIRHLAVHQHQIDRLARQHVECLLAIAG